MGDDTIKGMSIDTVILDEIGDITIDLGSTMSSGYVVNDTIQWTTLTSPTISTISTGLIWDHNISTDNTFVVGEYKEFVDTMPPIQTIHDMCEIYPGLKKAFDHFKDIYDLVKGDYEARKNEEW